MPERGTRTLAIDIPSGVDGATGEIAGAAVAADETITFVARKPGLLFEPGRSHAGRVTVADIGIELGTVSLFVPEVGDLRLPRREASAHKWSSGLMVFGGSNGLTGAPLMAARAGARTGAGIVVCSLPGHEAAAAGSGAEIVTPRHARDRSRRHGRGRGSGRVEGHHALPQRSRSVRASAATTARRPRPAGWSPRRRSPSSSTPTR